MRVTILGCGASAGVPLIGGVDGQGAWGACDPAEPRNRRTRTSIVIEQDGSRLLVDTSPDMRGQLLDCRIGGVDAVLYTHAHADHVAGIDDVRALNRALDHGRGGPLPAYGTQATLDELRNRFAYVFQEWRTTGFFRPTLDPRPIAPGDTVRIGALAIQVFDQDHGFVRSLGLRAGSFGYSTDVVDLDDAAFATLAGVDTWVVGCFQRAPHVTHAGIELVRRWVDRLQPRRTILTHMSPDLDWAWMQRSLPPGIEPASDGMRIEL